MRSMREEVTDFKREIDSAEARIDLKATELA